jgi:hypothetical protein
MNKKKSGNIIRASNRRILSYYRIYFYISLCLVFITLSSLADSNKVFEHPPAAIARVVNNYEIKVAGMKVGKLIATKEIRDNTTIYTLSSDASVVLLHHYKVKEVLMATYQNNILQHVSIWGYMGKKSYSSAIHWNKDHYDININGYHYSRQSTEYAPIKYSIARIYFEEPPVNERIFSEDYGVFSNISFQKEHEKNMVFEGHKNKFVYASGEMVKAEIQNSIKEFVIVKEK